MSRRIWPSTTDFLRTGLSFSDRLGNSKSARLSASRASTARPALGRGRRHTTSQLDQQTGQRKGAKTPIQRAPRASTTTTTTIPSQPSLTRSDPASGGFGQPAPRRLGQPGPPGRTCGQLPTGAVPTAQVRDDSEARPPRARLTAKI